MSLSSLISMRNTCLLIFLGILLPVTLLAQDPSVPPDTLQGQVDTLPASEVLLLDMTTTLAQYQRQDSLLRDSLANLNTQLQLIQAQLANSQSELSRMKRLAHRRLKSKQYTDTLYGNYDTVAFHTCAANPEQVSIQLFSRKKKGRKRGHTFGSVAELAQDEGKEMVFAMNAGMFERDRSAKGLLIVEGETYQQVDTLTQGYGNFYMQPNGIFCIDSSGKAYVLRTEEYRSMAEEVSFRIATQSGPMMAWVEEGKIKINPLFNDGSPNHHIRNAVGVTALNEVIFAISSREVTFYEMTSYMLEQGCTSVLYLDGAISQAYMPDLGKNSLQAGNGLGPIVVIME